MNKDSQTSGNKVNIDLFYFDIALTKEMQKDLDVFYAISEKDRYILKSLADDKNKDEFYKKFSEVTKFEMPKIYFTVEFFFVRYDQIIKNKI